MEEAYGRIERLRTLVDCFVQVDGGVKQDERQAGARRGRGLARRRQRHLRERRPDARLSRLGRSPGMSLQRALELADEAQGRAYPKPTVGAVVVAGDEIVGEGATEAAGRHGEIVALEAAGERARGATLYVTMEPCAHHGTTPPCVDAVLAAGIARVVAGSRDPNPEAGGGLERLEAEGVAVELADSVEARRQNEAWRTWVAEGRPVRHLQGRDHARRPRHGAGLALGLGTGVPPAGAQAACCVRRGRGRHGHRAAREPPPRRPRRRRDAPAAPARVRQRAAPRRLRARAALRAARGGARRARGGGRPVAPARGRADSRRAPSSAPVSSTSCCSSSRRCSPAPALGSPTGSRRRSTLVHLTTRQVGDDVLLEAYLREP